MRKTSGGSETASLKNHCKKCSVCKSEHREEIEDRYLQGASPYELEKDYRIRHQSLYRHIRAFRLEIQRRPDFLDRITRQILASVDFDSWRPGERTVIKAMELCARLSGEMYEGQLKALVSAGIIVPFRGIDRQAKRAMRKVGISREVINLLR